MRGADGVSVPCLRGWCAAKREALKSAGGRRSPSERLISPQLEWTGPGARRDPSGPGPGG